MNKFTLTSAILVLSAFYGSASAKLPPPSPEAQATAAAAKEKSDWGAKVAAYQLCLSQNKTAAHYFKTTNSGGKPSMDTPACTDPGPMAQAQAASTVGVADAKPVPAAGKAPTPAAK